MGAKRSTKKKRTKGGRRLAVVGRVFLTIFLIGLLTAVICGTVFAIYVKTNNDEKLDIAVDTMKLKYTSVVYYLDENGQEQELERLFSTQNRTWADLNEMPVHLKNAAIAIEDERFESHHGVDWYRTAGAAVNLSLKCEAISAARQLLNSWSKI